MLSSTTVKVCIKLFIFETFQHFTSAVKLSFKCQHLIHYTDRNHIETHRRQACNHTKYSPRTGCSKFERSYDNDIIMSLKEYYEMVNEARPLSEFPPQMLI